MINKKTVFNVVYAIAIIGLISTCFGFLSELVNFTKMQKYNAEESSASIYLFSKEQEKRFIKFYRIALILGIFATAAFIVNLFFKNKKYRSIGFICSAVFAVATCVVIFLLSHSLFKSEINSAYTVQIQSDEYLAITTFRTAAISFTCYTAVLIVCNLIDFIRGHKKSPEQIDETTKE